MSFFRRRSEVISTAIVEAIEAHREHEKNHPVPYDRQQRIEAILDRVRATLGSKVDEAKLRPLIGIASDGAFAKEGE